MTCTPQIEYPNYVLNTWSNMAFTAVDIEAGGLSFRHGVCPFLIAACSEEGEFKTWEWDLDPFTREGFPSQKTLREVQSYLDSFDEIVFHNASYDVAGLEHLGLTIPWSKIHDTMLMGHIHNSGLKMGLKDMSLTLLGYPVDDEVRLGEIANTARRLARSLDWETAEPGHDHFSGMSWGGTKRWKMDMWLPRQLYHLLKHPTRTPDIPRVPVNLRPRFRKYITKEWASVCSTYAKCDVERTATLYYAFNQSFTKEHQALYQEQREVLRVVYGMEHNGISLIDSKQLNKSRRHLTRRRDVFKARAEYIAGIDNLASDAQVRDYLFERCKFKPITLTATGTPSVGKDVINTLYPLSRKRSREFLTYYIAFKRVTKALQAFDSYVEGSIDGVLYPSFNVTGTKTTRFSSSNPNGHNVGKGGLEPSTPDKPGVPDEVIELLQSSRLNLRSVFGPRKGRVWWAIDYSQLQLRVFAYESGEQSLVQAFDDGWDAHDYMAHRIYGLDADIPASSLQRRVAKNTNFGFIFGATDGKINSTSGVKGLSSQLQRMFPNARGFINDTKATVKAHQRVHTRNGYPLTCYEDHAGVNYIVQGDEGIIVKRALVAIDSYLSQHLPSGFITLQVHDEVIVDVPKRTSFKHLRRIMSLMVDAGQSLEMVTPVESTIITDNWSNGETYAA